MIKSKNFIFILLPFIFLLKAVFAETALNIKENDFVIGNENANITIIEYASLSCSHCADFHVNTLEDLKKEYVDNGIVLQEDLSHCDLIMGIKEVPIDFLIPKKKFLFFSHTIKKQPYNQHLLKEIIRKKIDLIDYEVLKNINGERIIGFGRYAGIVGAYNAFLTYGLKMKK